MVMPRGGSSTLRVVKVSINGPFDSDRLASTPVSSRYSTELPVQPGTNCGYASRSATSAYMAAAGYGTMALR